MARKKCIPELRPLSKREEKLCQEVINRGFVDNLNAYRAAGYHPTTNNAIAIACNKIAEPKIQRRINEIVALKEVKFAISREWVAQKHLEYIRLAENQTPKDLVLATTNLKLLGESLGMYKQGVFDASDEMAEITEEHKRLAALIPDDYFLQENTKSPELPAGSENSAYEDAPGSTKSVESEVIVPPEQCPHVESAQ